MFNKAIVHVGLTFYQYSSILQKVSEELFQSHLFQVEEWFIWMLIFSVITTATLEGRMLQRERCSCWNFLSNKNIK